MTATFLPYQIIIDRTTFYLNARDVCSNGLVRIIYLDPFFVKRLYLTIKGVL